MKVSLVPIDHVQNVWPDILPYVEIAADYTYGRYDADDILDSIMQYNHDLWIAFDETKIKGIVVTAFRQYPKKSCLDLVFLAGEDGFSWKEPMLSTLRHWAYDNQCDTIESSGRLGWSKVFKDDGYKPLWQTYELPVASSGLGG